MKKLLSVFLTILTMLSVLAMPISAAEAKEAETAFAGKRQVVFTIDYSDLNNYFNGGRTTFDLILRSHTPSWLTYSMSTVGRDIHLSMEFSFATMEEYCEKVGQLIQDTAYISYHDDGNNLFLLEAHQTTDFLNFIYDAMEDSFTYENITPDSLFHLSKNILVLNGKELTIGDKAVFLPEGESIILLSSLSVNTAYNDGIFERSIIAAPDNSEELEKLVAHFKAVGETAAGDDGTVKVTFSAPNRITLNNMTSRCLYTACSIQESEEVLEGIAVGVRCSERFDLENLLSEYGSFSYQYTYPDYYRNVKTIEEPAEEEESDEEETEEEPSEPDVKIEQGTIRTEVKQPVSYSYERDFLFSGVDIKTDFTHRYGKFKKVITFRAPTQQAALYHDAIKSLLEEQMYDGVTLNIYDDETTRYYELSFSSWLIKDINKFAEDILGDSYSCNLSDSWFPRGKSTICESVQSNKLSVTKTPPTTMTATYVFPKGASFSADKDIVIQQEGNTLTTSLSAGKDNDVEYRRFHWAKCIILGVSLIVVVILILVAVHYIKKLVARLKKVYKKKVEQRKQQQALEQKRREEEEEQKRKQQAEEAEKRREQEEQAKKLQEEYKKRQEMAAKQQAATPAPIHPPAQQPTATATSAPTQPSVKKFCPKCGKPLSGAVGFCGHCGTKLQ